MIFKDLPPVVQTSTPGPATASEYADVVPIPFFPDDLPVLDFSDQGFAWTQDELNEACRLARLLLFPHNGATEGLK